MAEIYFDNSATTKISDGAKNKMIEVMDKHFGNPSSLHAVGLDAEHIMEWARSAVLASLGINRGVRGELVFTSGGTESNNLAILGVVNAKARRGNEKILTTQGEHASVEHVLAFLEKKLQQRDNALIFLGHGNNHSLALSLKEKWKNYAPQISTCYINPVMGVHTGKDPLLVAYLENSPLLEGL